MRTCHLRIRSSILKEALQDNSEVPGGKWRLVHLKGTELVADGCTKPLHGQAFARFLEDLGLNQGGTMEKNNYAGATTAAASTTDQRGATIAVLVTGGFLYFQVWIQRRKKVNRVALTPCGHAVRF